MKKVIPLFIGLGLLSSCLPPLQNHTKGVFSLQVQWPQASSSTFQIKTIPDETTQIKIIIQGEGLAEPLERTLTRQSDETKITLNLPPGAKTIKIQALGPDGKILAEDTQEATIKAGQVVRASMDLQIIIEEPVKPSPEATATPLPNSSGGGGSASGSGGNAPPGNTPVGGGERPGGPSGPTSGANNPNAPNITQPNTTPPQPSFNHTPSILTSGGGGGGSAQTNTTTTTADLTGITVSSVLADPIALSGMGYPTELVATVSDATALTDANYQWSCDENLGQFNRIDGPKVIWKAPTTPPAGVSPHTFTLRVKIVDANGVVVSELTTTVTAESGTGSVGTGSGGQ